MQEQETGAPEEQATTMEEQLYVAGILVHAAPAHIQAVRSWISRLPSAQVHGAADGKLVVTFEAATSAALSELLSQLRDRRGVLSALPVYQHNEPAVQIDEEEIYGD